MGKKVIKMSLSGRSIYEAMKKLEKYKQNIILKTNLLRIRLSRRLAELAQEGFNGAIVDDLLIESGGARKADVDVTVDNRDRVSVVIAKGDDVLWVEFGAGVYHNGSAGSSPHPKGSELGMTIGDYGDGNGKRNVWGYYENGELRLTHGTPAKMPMYNAARTVCDEIDKIAKEVFR